MHVHVSQQEIIITSMLRFVKISEMCYDDKFLSLILIWIFQQGRHDRCSGSIIWDPDSIVDELQNGFHERVSSPASIQHYLALIPNGNLTKFKSTFL
jgi:hypothetical protein